MTILDLGKTNSMPIKTTAVQRETKTKLNTPFPSFSLLPRLNFILSFPVFYLLPCSVTQGDGGQRLNLDHNTSLLLLAHTVPHPQHGVPPMGCSSSRTASAGVLSTAGSPLCTDCFPHEPGLFSNQISESYTLHHF